MEPCHLRLYVTGNTPRSRRAITNVRRLCDSGATGCGFSPDWII